MKTNFFIFLALPFLWIQCENEATQQVLVPTQSNEYVWIYQPTGDYFFGPDTERLKEGEWYDDWVPNDHTFVKGEDGRWHIFGITHPMVKTPPIHEGEFASFHAVSAATNFKEAVEQFHYSDLPKVLPPKERPGEVLANHAPYIIKKDGLYQMIYGHSPIRLAVSDDLMKWEVKGALFSEEDGARDPNILFHDGTYYATYCSIKSVRLRKSKDLVNWSEAVTILQTNQFDPESPSLIYHNNSFYLFVCAWEGNWDGKELQGAYTHKAHVYLSDDLMNFGTDDEKIITTLNAHAPEIFQDEEGQWYISSVVWPYMGVSVDKLHWKEQQ